MLHYFSPITKVFESASHFWHHIFDNEKLSQDFKCIVNSISVCQNLTTPQSDAAPHRRCAAPHFPQMPCNISHSDRATGNVYVTFKHLINSWCITKKRFRLIPGLLCSFVLIHYLEEHWNPDWFWLVIHLDVLHSHNSQTKSDRHSPLETLKGLDGRKEVVIETCRRDEYNVAIERENTSLEEEQEKVIPQIWRIENLWCSSHFCCKGILIWLHWG